ncbi:MAG: multidrug effflux MFS transporter [Proteobacteria bacterium]|nr:multidrug effflux MFS transporter [Pseudomonadota bacterium]MBI3499489.1 multidrug effflux MFS transporter [Pseudomonadota bacterium]
MPDVAPRPPVILLIVASALGPLALNIFIPSMPRLAEVFATDFATVQLTLTLYLIGVSLGQLVYGPLSDRFGRRPLLLAGVALYALSALGALLAQSIGVLIVARIAQALGGCAGLVLSRAIVRDAWSRGQAATVLAYMNMAMSVAPALAPAVGAAIDAWLGWRAIFAALAGVGFLLAAGIWWALPETHHERAPLPGLAVTIMGYWRLMRQRAFLGYSCSVAFSATAFYAFLAGAPYLVVEVMREPPRVYALWYFGVSAGYIFGSFLAARLMIRLGVERMIVLGALVAITGVLAMALLGAIGILSPAALFLPMICVTMGNGLSQPGAIIGAVSVDPRAFGAASGLLGCLQMAIGALGTLAIGHMLDRNQMPLALFMLAALTLSATGTLLTRRTLTGPGAAVPAARPVAD